jgi:hypothetical protein
MDFIEIDFLNHPHHSIANVTPEYLRHCLNLQFKRIHAMVTQEFTDALAALVAAVKASSGTDPAVVAAAVAASQAEDLQAVTDLTAAQTPAPAP